MSAQAHTQSQPHGSLRDYLTGFFLSVMLTIVPFWLVMGDVMENKQATAFLIMGFAALQMIVHVVFFLHMRARSEEGWTLVSLIFTLLMVGITLTGSLWVMHHLNSNMVPKQEMSEMP